MHPTISDAWDLLDDVNLTLERAASAAAERNDDVHVPAPDWRGCTSVNEMSTAQYSLWCDQGKPSLEQQLSREQRRRDQDQVSADAADRALVRYQTQQYVQRRLEALASVLGQEVAVITAELRSEIAELKAKLASRDAEDVPPTIKLIGGGRNG